MSSKIALAISLAVLSAPTFAADSVAALLKQADAFRLPNESARVETHVELYRNDVLDKDRLYTVYVKPGRRSLVLMKSPSEIGQKVLMLADQFWLLMPESQRPLRITASQKLLGEASTGDIASMTWSEDYDGSVKGESDCPQPAAPLPEVAAPPERATAPKTRRCLHLDLAQARAGVTYARVELYLDKATRVPVKADLYVGSGKRAKEAWYVARPVDGQQRIMAMLLLDDIQPNRRTVIRYRSIVPKQAPDEFFNPAALVRNSLAGW
ncbi:MAG: outer membrane lipoprotein-sorting protein [Rhodocyclaceae bacterium]|nr:outer membrane lipoprotein-sorting protein [Rhodocyclaceae bacterium]